MIRHRVRPLVVVAAVVFLVGCASAPEKPATPNADADSKVIADTLTQYISAWKAADAGKIADLYSTDAVILPGDHPAESDRPGIVKYNQDFFDQYTPGDFSITTQDRKILGDWAFDQGSYTFTATPKAGGKVLSDRGKYIVIMHRQADGSWKWYRDIDNSDGPESSPAPETKK